MMRRLACAAGLLLVCALGSACNDADVIARREILASDADAGAAVLDCGLQAQLRRQRLPSGIGNLFLPACEWPITQADSTDDLRWLVPDIVAFNDTKAHVCATNPRQVLQEPPPPAFPQKLIFCPGACEWTRNWLTCRLRADPCNVDVDVVDSGVNFCP